MAEQELFDSDKLHEAVERLNKLYSTRVALEENSRYTLHYGYSSDTIFWHDSLHPLPLKEGLSALAHEFAHAVTVFYNIRLLSYEDIDELIKTQVFECIGIQFEELLDQMLCEWWNLDYDEIRKWLAEKCLELSKNTAGKHWLQRYEPRLIRTVDYFSRGGHVDEFTQLNEGIASILGVEPQSLGIDEMEYVYDEVF